MRPLVYSKRSLHTMYSFPSRVCRFLKKATILIYIQTLFDAGIKPSDTQTYSISAIQNALEAAHGSEVVVRCRNGALNEIRYYFNVAGNVQSGTFVPSTPCMLESMDGELDLANYINLHTCLDPSNSNCPRDGIRYIPKRAPSVPTNTQTSNPTAAPTGSPPKDPFVGKGHLDVWAFDRQIGCIISRGTWFTSGTCATFVAEPSTTSGKHSFSLQFSPLPGVYFFQTSYLTRIIT